jgi:hypothetical protein
MVLMVYCGPPSMGMVRDEAAVGREREPDPGAGVEVAAVAVERAQELVVGLNARG